MYALQVRVNQYYDKTQSRVDSIIVRRGSSYSQIEKIFDQCTMYIVHITNVQQLIDKLILKITGINNKDTRIIFVNYSRYPAFIT